MISLTVITLSGFHRIRQSKRINRVYQKVDLFWITVVFSFLEITNPNQKVGMDNINWNHLNQSQISQNKPWKWNFISYLGPFSSFFGYPPITKKFSTSFWKSPKTTKSWYKNLFTVPNRLASTRSKNLIVKLGTLCYVRLQHRSRNIIRDSLTCYTVSPGGKIRRPSRNWKL